MHDFLLLYSTSLQHRILILFLGWLFRLRRSHFHHDLLINPLNFLLGDDDVMLPEKIYEFFQGFFLELFEADQGLFGLIAVVITKVHQQVFPCVGLEVSKGGT